MKIAEEVVNQSLYLTNEVRFRISQFSSQYDVPYLHKVKAAFLEHEEKLKECNRLTLIVSFFLFVYLILLFFSFLLSAWNKINSTEKIKSLAASIAIFLFPSVRKYVSEKRDLVTSSVRKGFKHEEIEAKENLVFRQNGQDAATIIKRIQNMSTYDREIITSDNKISGAIYVEDLSKFEYFVAESMNFYAFHNLLHPELFSSARFIESQLITIAIDLFKGDTKSQICGNITSGGTESIIFAMTAYLHLARARGVTEPELIYCSNAHAAFIKACDSFNIKKVIIPYDRNYRMDNSLVRKAINKNTICIISSFPSYPHGIDDDIEGLSEIAVAKNVPLHVDCCLGGLLVAFFKDAKIKIPKFDFSLPGVTSLSADFHKYGQSSKGVSVLLYKNKYYRRGQFFIYPKWNGGLYFSASYNGSRTPAFLAASYAVMLHLGKQKLVKQAKEIHEAIVDIADFVKKECPMLKVLGDPKICVIGIAGDQITHINSFLTTQRKWHFTQTCNPIAIHFAVTSGNLQSIKKFLKKDLKDACDWVTEHPNEKLHSFTEMYGLSVALPEDLVKSTLDCFVDCMLDY